MNVSYQNFEGIARQMNDTGQGLIEYTILVILIGFTVVTSVSAMGIRLDEKYELIVLAFQEDTNRSISAVAPRSRTTASDATQHKLKRPRKVARDKGR